MKVSTTVLAFLACAGVAAALPPLPKPPGPPGNPACLAHIGTLRNGACSNVAKKVTKDIATKITGASCAELEAMDVTADVRLGGGVLCFYFPFLGAPGMRWLWLAARIAAPPALTHTALRPPIPSHTCQASEACCADAVKFVQDVSCFVWGWGGPCIFLVGARRTKPRRLRKAAAANTCSPCMGSGAPPTSATTSPRPPPTRTHCLARSAQTHFTHRNHTHTNKKPNTKKNTRAAGATRASWA
jgi:hypothetical protein